MIRSLIILLCLTLFVGCSRQAPLPPDELDWPGMFGRHNNATTRQRVDVSRLPPGGPREVWRVPVGRGYSTPVAAGGRIVLLHRIGDEEHVDCLDAETGRRLWRHSYPTTYRCKYEYSDGPYGTPLIHEGRVYSLGAQWQAQCLDLEDGSVVWRRELADDFPLEEGLFGFGPGVVVEAGKLIFNLGADGAGVVALDAQTGETVWQATRDRASYTTPRVAVAHGRRRVFVQTFEGLRVLDPETGQSLAFTPFQSLAPDSVAATSPLVDGERVLLATGPGPGALRLELSPEGKLQKIWSDRRSLDSQWNPLIPFTDNDGARFVFGFTSKRRTSAFRCLDLATGEVRWSWTSDLERGTGLLAGVGSGSPVLILWGEHGHLAFVEANAEEHRLRWMSDKPLLESPTYSSPALHRGLLLLRNEAWLVCLSLRREEPTD